MTIIFTDNTFFCCDSYQINEDQIIMRYGTCTYSVPLYHVKAIREGME